MACKNKMVSIEQLASQTYHKGLFALPPVKHFIDNHFVLKLQTKFDRLFALLHSSQYFFQNHDILRYLLEICKHNRVSQTILEIVFVYKRIKRFQTFSDKL